MLLSHLFFGGNHKRIIDFVGYTIIKEEYYGSITRKSE